MKYEYVRLPDGQFECPHCKAVKPLQSTMHMHYKAHHDGTFKHKCKSCNFETSTKQALDKHMLSKHPEKTGKKEKEFACPSCPFETASKAGLRSHYLLKHMTSDVVNFLGRTEDNKIQCTHCGDGFESKPAFVYHLAKCLPAERVQDNKVREALGL